MKKSVIAMLVMVAMFAAMFHMEHKNDVVIPQIPAGYTEMYTSRYTVGGETLDSIVSDQMQMNATADVFDSRQLKAEIIRLNDIKNEDLIHAGCYLAIPYVVKKVEQ